MKDVKVSIFAECMSVEGAKKQELVELAEKHFLDWYTVGNLFYFSGKPTCLYNVLVEMSLHNTLIVN